jgi:uncharacterized protein (TIGR02001 family)
MDAQVAISPKLLAPDAALAAATINPNSAKIATLLTLVLALALLLLPFASGAEGSWSASLGATSNYVYRGISQTYGGSAVQLGATYQSALGWFAGAWGSNVDPYPGGESFEELDLYTGVIRPLGKDFTVQGTYTHYGYVHDPRYANYDRNEISVAVAYLDLIAASVSYQPDATSYSQLGFAQRRSAVAYELTARRPLPKGFAVTAGAGYYDLHDLFGVGYWAGDLGLSYVHRRLTLGISRFFCDNTAERLYEGASASRAWAVSAVLRF